MTINTIIISFTAPMVGAFQTSHTYLTFFDFCHPVAHIQFPSVTNDFPLMIAGPWVLDRCSWNGNDDHISAAPSSQAFHTSVQNGEWWQQYLIFVPTKERLSVCWDVTECHFKDHSLKRLMGIYTPVWADEAVVMVGQSLMSSWKQLLYKSFLLGLIYYDTLCLARGFIFNATLLKSSSVPEHAIKPDMYVFVWCYRQLRT